MLNEPCDQWTLRVQLYSGMYLHMLLNGSSQTMNLLNRAFGLAVTRAHSFRRFLYDDLACPQVFSFHNHRLNSGFLIGLYIQLAIPKLIQISD